MSRHVVPLHRPHGVEVLASRVWHVGLVTLSCHPRGAKMLTFRGWCVGTLLHCVAHVAPLRCPRGVEVLASRGRRVSHMASLCRPCGAEVSASRCQRVGRMAPPHRPHGT